ncbi:hypothetical protein IE53DRAFT_389900 [Violaceomyces palustris]|uniref:Uncharacterized protein n=1 Tax=Violaceomyces palustris TaxID=1673888 RepID=A0ACD0NQ50_9BASI|nr:hypothetical protein IE53DRAFT_389900 [Violaceomyces palustris]
MELFNIPKASDRTRTSLCQVLLPEVLLILILCHNATLNLITQGRRGCRSVWRLVLTGFLIYLHARNFGWTTSVHGWFPEDGATRTRSLSNILDFVLSTLSVAHSYRDVKLLLLCEDPRSFRKVVWKQKTLEEHSGSTGGDVDGDEGEVQGKARPEEIKFEVEEVEIGPSMSVPRLEWAIGLAFSYRGKGWNWDISKRIEGSSEKKSLPSHLSSNRSGDENRLPKDKRGVGGGDSDYDFEASGQDRITIKAHFLRSCLKKISRHYCILVLLNLYTSSRPLFRQPLSTPLNVSILRSQPLPYYPLDLFLAGFSGTTSLSLAYLLLAFFAVLFNLSSPQGWTLDPFGSWREIRGVETFWSNYWQELHKPNFVYLSRSIVSFFDQAPRGVKGRLSSGVLSVEGSDPKVDEEKGKRETAKATETTIRKRLNPSSQHSPRPPKQGFKFLVMVFTLSGLLHMIPNSAFLRQLAELESESDPTRPRTLWDPLSLPGVSAMLYFQTQILGILIEKVFLLVIVPRLKDLSRRWKGGEREEKWKWWLSRMDDADWRGWIGRIWFFAWTLVTGPLLMDDYVRAGLWSFDLFPRRLVRWHT